MSPAKPSRPLQETPGYNAAPLQGSVGETQQRVRNRAAPRRPVHASTGDSRGAAPGAGSAACASAGVLLSAISCARRQLLRYSRGGGDLTLIAEDTGPNVLQYANPEAPR